MANELETHAARLFTVGFHGTAVTDSLRRLIERGVGGVIFFSRNVGLPDEVFDTTRAIKAMAGRPLLLSLDQEGGAVARLRRGFSEVPPMRVVGATGSAKLAYEVGQLLGREVGAVGFDMNFAPVLDIDSNPQNPVIGGRSFGRTPELVSELGVALAAGLESVGVAACGKHFPGHGDTSQDSHLELPRLGHSLERLEQVELKPFRAAVKSGIPSLMTAHVVFEPLDALYPATMSRAVVRGILRDTLGYDGLVVSDDLEMRAIVDHFGVEQAAIRGLDAGVDHFLCCHSEDVAQNAIDAVIHAVERGVVSRETLSTAHRRLTALTERYARPVRDRSTLSVLRSEAHLALIERILSDAAPSLGRASPDPTESSGLPKP